jgi:predicted DNA-binding transcriptional regulator AlpA
MASSVCRTITSAATRGGAAGKAGRRGGQAGGCHSCRLRRGWHWRGGTGIGSWETKVEVTAHLRALELPVTILRRMASMELMTERKFFPAASVWQLMPKLMGATRPMVWLTVEDRRFPMPVWLFERSILGR